MSAKIISFRLAAGLLALALVISGCRPAGPSALLRGKKYLERGDYEAAVTQFKTATTLLATNAAAWNYYGVALQHADRPIDAANAYQRALELNRDFPEARLNLGTLWLEQNKPEDAKTEFTAYTLRWPNDPAGWLKLGSARLQLGDIVPAERCFSTVIALKTNEAEAYNGLGMALMLRKRPQDAVKYFAAAIQWKPDYAPALLNLATVSHDLHDDKTALENYHAWLALTPRPANWDDVNAIATEIEKTPVTVAAATPSAPAPAPVRVEFKPAPPPATVAEAKPQPKAPSPEPARILQSPRAQSASTPTVSRPAPAPEAPPKVVQVAPEPVIVTRPNAATAPATTVSPKPEKSADNATYVAYGVTPLPGTVLPPAAPATVAAPRPRPIKIIPPTPVNFPRYNYISPRPPATGDRRAAGGAFNQARQAEEEQKWQSALGGYQEAARLDPSWFEAQYNAGVIAQRLRNYAAALAGYETALALQPDSVNARYNFALSLKAAGYVPDAANELKKILAAHPREARAHLALANLCAQALHDPAQAREHYLKVLELDPANPETANIRFWLAANPAE